MGKSVDTLIQELEPWTDLSTNLKNAIGLLKNLNKNTLVTPQIEAAPVALKNNLFVLSKQPPSI